MVFRFFRGLITLLNRTDRQVDVSLARRPRRLNRFRPHLEYLQSRIAPAVDIWTGANHAVDINWSDGLNWSLARAPASSDVAEFTGNQPDGNSVADQNFTVAGLQIDGTWGATLTVGQLNNPVTLTLASGSTNEWDSGTIYLDGSDGTLVNNGTLRLNGAGAVGMGGGGTFQNNGIVNQTGAGNLDVGHNGGNLGTALINAAGATYDFQNNSSITNNGSVYGPGGTLTNNGLIEKTAGTGSSSITGFLTNTGTLDAGTGTLGFPGSVSDTNGTLQAAGGAILDLTGGNGAAKFAENGTFTGAGTGAIYLDTGALATGSSGATLNIPSTLAFDWSAGTISVPLNATLTYNGTLTLNGSGGVELSGGGTFQNNGTINLTGAGNLDIGHTGGNATTTLLNPAGATIDIENNSSITNNGTPYGPGGPLMNAGTIEKTAGTGTLSITGFLSNTGTLDIATGTFGLPGSAGDTNGMYDIATGAILDLTGGNGFASFTEKGTFTGSGAGSIYLDTGTLTTGSSGATLNIPSTLAFDWSAGTISVPLNATLTYNGTLTVTGSSGVELTGGGTFQNNGTINLAGTGNLDIGHAGGSPMTTLVNVANATIDFQNNSSITNNGTPYGPGGTVVNAGTIEKTAVTGVPAGTSSISGPLTNTGTLDAATGTLALSFGITATGGTYQVAAGSTLDLTSGGTFSETGTFTASGAGTISLNGGTFAVYNNTATLDIPDTISFQWTGGAISVPTGDSLTVNGNLTFNGTSTEYLVGGGTMTENGTITQSGTGYLLIGSPGNVATTLIIPSGSTYDFTADSGIANQPYNGSGVIDYSGTIEKTGGGASSPMSTAFSNTGGTLSVTSGTLTLSTNGGENTGGTFNVAAGAILNLTGGNAVTYSGTYTGSGAGEVELAGGTLSVAGGTSGATFNLPGNLFVWSGGTVNTNGDTLTILGNMTINSVNGSEVVTGGGYLDVGSASAAGTLNDSAVDNTLTIDTRTTLLIGSNGTVNLSDDTINGNGAISNLGNLIKSAGTSGATISAFMDNEKNVEVQAGMLTFSGTVHQVFNNHLTGGSWTVAGTAANATLNISSASFNTIDPGATVIVNGPYAGFANLNSLTTNEGSFSLLGGATFATAGNFTNAGTLALMPGTTLNSVLTVNGTFTQTGMGTLDAGLGGTTTTPTFGSISSTGAVTLAGTFKVTSSVVVKVGASFDILRNGSHLATSSVFAALAQGAKFTMKVGTTTMIFQISYKGGNSLHDVVITRIR
jgi:hypothetical protein